jgi:VCBS repeat-containing protein
MATQTTGGGSTTSFTNTPQAKDDNYLFLEDALRNDASLYSETTKIITLDVMSNDLGGNAKTLFSVEDGDGNALTADYELLCKDVNAAGVSNWELTLGGNWVRINNGKIEYVIADGSGIAGQGRSVDSLTDGQNFNDQFVYAIRLGNGTLSEATVKINITGRQDAAAIATDGASDNSVTEAGGVANGTPGDPNACGTLKVTDADAGENKFKPVSGSALNGAYGTFTFDENSGKWTYTLDNGRPATEALAQGDTKTETLTVCSLDGSASYTINVTVTGTNDGPVANADLGGVTENQVKSFDVLANDTDADDGHVLSLVSATAPPGKGSASIVAGQVQFDPGSAFDHLADGVTEQVVVSYTMQDEHGAQSSSTLTITVTGTNDGPVANADLGGAGENETKAFNVIGNDTDVDDGHVLSLFSIDGVTVNGNPASVPEAGAFSIVGGQVQFTPGTAFDHLAEGASASVVVSYTVKDEHGAPSSSTLTLTVNGTNDTPVAVADTGSAGENQNKAFDVVVNDTDADDGHSLSLFSINGVTVDGNPASAAQAGAFSIVGGQVQFTPGTAFDYLAQNSSASVVISYTVHDEHGAASTSTLTLTVTGSNDAPVLTGTQAVLLGGTEEVNYTIHESDLLAGFTDVDGGDLRVSSLTAFNGSLTDNFDGTWTFHPNTNFNGTVNLTYSVVDGHGGIVSASNSFFLAPVNDAANFSGNDVGFVTEDAAPNPITGQMFAVDPDGISESAFQPQANTLGTYGSFSINAAGAWSYTLNNADPDTNALADGQPTTDVFTIASVDGTTTVVTINVTGANDAPALTASVTSHNYVDTVGDDSFGSVLGSLSTVDPDTGDTATYSVTGGVADLSLAGYTHSKASAYGTLYLNQSTGAYQFVPNDAAIEGLNTGQNPSVAFSLVVTDSHGATDSETLTINLTGATDGPAPTANADKWVLSDLTTIPAATITPAWFLNNDTDSDSASLFVTNVTGLPVGLTANYDGAGHLVSITGTTPAAGTFALTYTVTDGANSTNGSVSVTVVDTSPGDNSLDFNTTYNGTDFSYVDLLGGQDSALGDTTLIGNAGIDVFIGNNGNDTLSGGGGNDKLFGNENAGSGVDTLDGGAGDDLVDGGNGSDIINGGLGTDILTGGNGNDIFVFDTALGGGNVDTITDFDANNNDKINLENSIFTAFGATTGTLSAANFVANAGGIAGDGNDFILYDTTTGNLYYDADGNGAGAKVLFASISLTGLTGTVDNTDFSII